MSQKDDINTVGMTPSNKSMMEELIAEGLFSEQRIAAKFLLALAIDADVVPGIMEKTDTTWNIGSLDRDGELRDLVNALYPENQAPYRLIEYLINKGLEMVREHKEKNGQIIIRELV